jgi:double-stranded uracil-DNA glycosylase
MGCMTGKLCDLLRPGLAVVFCGTAAGEVSAARGAYYAGPGNRFWRTLFETGLTPRQLKPEEFTPAYGIGLTDVAKSVSGSDASIPAHAFDRNRL